MAPSRTRTSIASDPASSLTCSLRVGEAE
jgi:hypothetical protein